jgi:DNA repair exonuclease SbcCD ATPase subunit
VEDHVNPSAWDYVRKAFNAKPIGMFVPPNWIGLGIFGLLGVLNPGFWIMGLGLELGYLWILSTHPRFQRFAAASKRLETQRQWQARVEDAVRQLNPDDQQHYRVLETRCRALLQQQLQINTPTQGLEAQGEGLGRLLWVYLRLLLTRQAINRVIRGSSVASEGAASLDERIAGLQARLNEPLTDDLRKSLTGQIEILQQRLERRREAKQKLAFLDAELTRIQEQVELVREQAVLTADSETLSQRIDQITTTLGSTAQWISDQQKLYGAVEDLMSEPPALRITNSE